jgi:hypothetical protein
MPSKRDEAPRDTAVMKALTVDRVKPVEREEAPSTVPSLGSWGFREARLCCVVHLGSNFITVRDHGLSWRIHLDALEREWVPCTLEMARGFITAQVTERQAQVRSKLEAINEVVARLGVGERQALTTEVMPSALTVRDPKAVPRYEAALVKARDEDLPRLFRELKDAQERLTVWLSYEALPHRAEVGKLESTLERIDERIFTVKLYAGLEEALTLVNEGAAPAAEDEPVHVWQGRLYIDEEFARCWEGGGATCRDVGAFSQWLAEPENLNTIIPAARGVVAFRVRREVPSLTQEHPLWGLAGDNPFAWAEWERRQKKTLLFLRNGQQLWRLEAPVVFPEKLFPDEADLTFNSAGLMVTRDGSVLPRLEVEGHTRDEVVDAVRQYIKERRAWRKVLKKKRHDHSFWETYIQWTPGEGEPKPWAEMVNTEDVNAHTVAESARRSVVDRWQPLGPESLYHDDGLQTLHRSMQEHNNIVLVLQGLLDRSFAFHPHPPWKLFTPEGLKAGLVLHRDVSRAFVPSADVPDFVDYVRKNQKTIKVGTMVFGAERAWRRRNIARNQKTQGRRSSSYYDRVDDSGMYGDNGPGKVARVVAVRGNKARFEWTRKLSWRTVDRKRAAQWNRAHPIETTTQDSIWVPLQELFNVEVYRPGDMKRFSNDPRTKHAYAYWGEMMLAGERWHAKEQAEGMIDLLAEEEEE